MKITSSLYYLVPVCFAVASFQSVKGVPAALSSWIAYKVDNQLSVQVPVQPTETDVVKLLIAQGVPAAQLEKVNGMRLLTATDGVGNYMIICTGNGTAAISKEPSSLVSFYDGMVSSILRNERGTLLKRSAFTASGAEGIDIDYKGLHKGTGKMVVKHSRILAVETATYMLSLYPVDRNDSTGVTLTEQRAKFFNSLSYKPANESAK